MSVQPCQNDQRRAGVVCDREATHVTDAGMYLCRLHASEHNVDVYAGDIGRPSHYAAHPKPILCRDCGLRWPTMYMVHDQVWAEANYGPRDVACVDCLERALRRPLTIADFKPDLPIHRLLMLGMRLAERANQPPSH